MGEKIGFTTVLTLFGAFILPILISIFVTQVEGSKIMSRTAEVRQMVSSEGGITDKVRVVLDRLEDYGVEITIKDSNGNLVTGRVPVGEQVYLEYKYKNFEIKNIATITRRS